MVGSHTPKGKSIRGIGGAIEHIEVDIEHTEFAKFEEVYIRHRWYYKHETSQAYLSPHKEQICCCDP